MAFIQLFIQYNIQHVQPNLIVDPSHVRPVHKRGNRGCSHQMHIAADAVSL